MTTVQHLALYKSVAYNGGDKKLQQSREHVKHNRSFSKQIVVQQYSKPF